MSLYSEFKPIPFQLSPERENQILSQVAHDLANEINPDILRAYPDYQAPTTTLPASKDRLAAYTVQTQPEDFPLLHDPQYMEKYKQGIYPQPVSPFWNGLLGLPPVFSHVQRDFIHVYKSLVGD